MTTPLTTVTSQWRGHGLLDSIRYSSQWRCHGLLDIFIIEIYNC
jgi:hypothetical protein